MKIVADENVDRLVIERLRSEGHLVSSIARDHPAAPDTEVLLSSYREKTLLITEDKDFGELIFHKKKSYSGVLLVRLWGVPRSKRIEMVCELIAQRGDDLERAFSVLSPSSIRIREKSREV